MPWDWDAYYEAHEAPLTKSKESPSAVTPSSPHAFSLQNTSRAGSSSLTTPKDVTTHPAWPRLTAMRERLSVDSLIWTLASYDAYAPLLRRRGFPLKSLTRDEVAAPLVAMAWCLGQHQVSLADADHFLETFGDWLSITREDLWVVSVAIGVMDKEGNVQIPSVIEASPATFQQVCDAFRQDEARRQAEATAWRQAKNQATHPRPTFGSPTAMPEDDRWMDIALKEAQVAYDAGEVPVGAVLVLPEGHYVAAHNQTATTGEPMAHAECLAIRKAVRQYRDLCPNGKLNKATLYVTLEPCPMCAGVIWEARVGRVVYGASDPQMGAMGGALNLFETETLNHHPTVVKGVKAQESQTLLRTFFQALRQKKGS